MKTCENCGSKVFNLGCVNCDEENFIEEQVELIEESPKQSSTDQGHFYLINDLKDILSLALNNEFHDFKNNKFPAPKMALVDNLNAIIENVKKGKYDN